MNEDEMELAIVGFYNVRTTNISLGLTAKNGYKSKTYLRITIREIVFRLTKYL